MANSPEKQPGESDPSALRLHAPPLPEQTSPGRLSCLITALGRKKPLDCRTETSLNRCLGLLDLTALGVGSTLGLGLYVQAGQVASTKAGPAVIFSFGLAALASAFSALCYAEFAGLVPKAGSAYAYSYITVGEFAAFIIGWNLVLEYVIGASSVTRGLSNYLAQLFRRLSAVWWCSSGVPEGNRLHASGQLGIETSTTFGLFTNFSSIDNRTMAPLVESLAIDPSVGWPALLADYIAKQFDWLSLVIIVVLAVLLLLGVKGSTNITMIFTVINLLVVGTIIIASVGLIDTGNWRLQPNQVPATAGQGGFMPFGLTGVIAGSSTCFYAFIGFDTIATSAEEARNPRRNIPIAILLSLGISFLAYMSVATCQTLLWPYYDQNRPTVLPDIFRQLGLGPIEWVVLLGALAGLSSSQLGGIYPLPRILYSMAQDRLIYRQLAHVHGGLQLPVRAILSGCFLVALLACLLDIEALTDMVSIGTLAAYSLVSISVLLVRYEPRPDYVSDTTPSSHLTPPPPPPPPPTARLSFGNLLEMADKVSHPANNNNGKLSKSAEQRCSDHPEDSCGPKKSKLSAKQSTPIRTKGSRALQPQLSVGFGSWFKGQNQDHEQQSSLSEKSWPLSNSSDRKLDSPNQPDYRTRKLSRQLIWSIVVTCLLLNLVALASYPHGPRSVSSTGSGPAQSKSLLEPQPAAISACILALLLVGLLVKLSRLPVNTTIHSSGNFRVPWVPLVPTLSILINMGLMLNLNLLTWIRFAVWMGAGLFIYFTYGLWNSRGYLLAGSTNQGH